MKTIEFVGLAPNTGVEVRSIKTGEHYQIWFDIPSKKWRCTCPHHVYRLFKRNTPCKHIEAILRGEIDNALDF